MSGEAKSHRGETGPWGPIIPARSRHRGRSPEGAGSPSMTAQTTEETLDIMSHLQLYVSQRCLRGRYTTSLLERNGLKDKEMPAIQNKRPVPTDTLRLHPKCLATFKQLQIHARSPMPSRASPAAQPSRNTPEAAAGQSTSGWSGGAARSLVNWHLTKIERKGMQLTVSPTPFF